MRINIVVKAGERLRQKIKYGFNLLFQPLRAEIIFSDEFLENAINIAYGDGPLFGKGKALCLNPSSEFEDCITDSRLPDISHLSWFDFAGKKLPKLFPISGAVFDFDIAAATFMLASEFQDLVSLERDEFDRLRAMDSLQDKLGVLDFPVVNYYSMLLKKKLEDFFNVKIGLKQYDGADHGLALTHDVDYTSSLNLKMIRRNVFGHAILNNGDLTPNERAMKLLYPFLAIAGYNPPKYGLKFLRSIETQSELKSTFFIKTGSTAKQDMNYNYRSRSMKNFVDSLIGLGFEIGIHPSMNTYLDDKQFITEKTRLEKVIGREINSVRQHYLKFTAGKTVGVWENAAMKYDSTLGFSRKAGFRNSVAFPFPLYNFKQDRISTVTELPLLIMDDTFANNRNLTTDQTIDKMKTLIDETKPAHGAASVLFHNSLADPIDFPGYKKIYERLLTDAIDSGFKMDTLSGIIENFR
ncbi:MAG: polysaccharide deacetylase family protein [Candidatus Kryptoniota bacterium]